EKSICGIACDINFAKNPFTDFTEISYTGATPGTRLSVIDMNGKEVARYELSESDGSVRIGDQLPAGLYFVRIPGPDSASSTITKLVKTR
ncbi:MAG: T9SS type A sorting domain-containing protein, partial [Bacteroidota bacterium]